MEFNIKAEKFISLLEQRPSIWNYKSQIFCDKERRQADWIEICKKMVPNYSQKSSSAQQAILFSLQKHWKVLRDGFHRAYKKQRNGSTKLYIHHKALKFLTKVYDHEYGSVQKTDEEDSSDKVSIDNDTEKASDSENSRVCTRLTYKRKVNTKVLDNELPGKKSTTEALPQRRANRLENESSPQQTHISRLEHDEDKLFLLSLLRDFKSIPEELKVDAKIEILNVLKNFSNREVNSQTSILKDEETPETEYFT